MRLIELLLTRRTPARKGMVSFEGDLTDHEKMLLSGPENIVVDKLLQTVSVPNARKTKTSTSWSLSKLLAGTEETNSHSSCPSHDNNALTWIHCSQSQAAKAEEGVHRVDDHKPMVLIVPCEESVSDYTLSTAGTLLEILRSPSTCTPGTVSSNKSTEYHSLHAAQLPTAPSSTTQLPTPHLRTDIDITMDILSHESMFADLDVQNIGLCNSDESGIIFQNGIEATDMGSLLEQFEAAESFPSSLSSDILPRLGFENILNFDPLDLSEVCEVPPTDCTPAPCTPAPCTPAPCTTAPCTTAAYLDAQPRNDVTDSEVVKLLKAPSRTKHVPMQDTMPSVDQKKRNSPKHSAVVLMENTLATKDVRHENARKDDRIKSKTSSHIGTASVKKNDKKRRLSLNQYQQRLRQRLDKENSDSVDSASSESCLGTSQAARRDYFRVIIDHDYCQNGPISAPSSPYRPDVINLGTSQSIKLHQTIAPGTAENDATLKSLLLSNNLCDELKVQAEKDRAVTRRNMYTADQCQDVGVLTKATIDATRQPPSQMLTVAGKNMGYTQTQPRFSDCNVEAPYAPTDTSQALIDKLPSYCTTLAVHSIPGMAIKKSGSACKFVDQAIPVFDRDPSPERSEPSYNKVPAYFSDFTNSSKYDHMPSCEQLDPKGQSYPWDSIRSKLPNCPPSGCDSPLAERRSRRRTRSPSQTDAPQQYRRQWRQRTYRYQRGSVSSRSRSKTRSRSRSTPRSKTRSRSTSSSSSCYSREHSPAGSRSRSWSHSPQRARRGSCDSKSMYRSPSRHRDSSSDSAYSWSTGHNPRPSKNHLASRYRSRSRLRDCSRDRTYRRNPMRSRSRSTSSQRTRTDNRHQRPRSRSREHSDTYRNHLQRKHEKEKAQKIEERRIVYVGRIPNGTLRQDLRKKFSYFGEIEEVSVHFREHGDNYGFVTFLYTCDAFAAVGQGNTLPDCADYELCFGGRRQFCKNDYADLDGDMEEDEEMGSVVTTRNLDFDCLLRQARQGINK